MSEEQAKELTEMLRQLSEGMKRVAEGAPELVILMPGLKWMPEQADVLLAKLAAKRGPQGKVT